MGDHSFQPIYPPLRALQERIRAELAGNAFLDLPTPGFPSRDDVLAASAEQLGLGHRQVESKLWLVAVDIGYATEVVTVMAIANGTTRVYLGERGGIVGVDEIPAVSEASAALLRLGAAALPECVPVVTTPRPNAGRTTVYLRTPQQIFGAEAAASSLTADRHPIAAVFAAGMAVLDALRNG